ncbi:MAG TPA: YceI family protein [Thermoanaerobaculia bacterium]|nr:YceI family protein [Thermoanaerobaculia bacterium]
MRTKTILQALVAMVVMLWLPQAVLAQPTTYKVDPVHSGVTFTVRHFVSEVEGRFKDYAGTIKYDAQHPADSSVQFTVQAASIDTGNDSRDKDLRSDNYFGVEKFPTLSFVSTKVTPKGGDTFDVTGNLTIKGVTKTITIPASFLGEMKTKMGERAGFRSAFTIKRSDYGVSGGAGIVGDDVNITIRVEAVRETAAAPK